MNKRSKGIKWGWIISRRLSPLHLNSGRNSNSGSSRYQRTPRSDAHGLELPSHPSVALHQLQTRVRGVGNLEFAKSLPGICAMGQELPQRFATVMIGANAHNIAWLCLSSWAPRLIVACTAAYLHPGRFHTFQSERMFKRRRPTSPGATGSDHTSSTSECIDSEGHPRRQLFDGSNSLSQEEKSRRLHEGAPRYCEGVCGLVPPPQGRPRWDKCSHSALRGADRTDDSDRSRTDPVRSQQFEDVREKIQVLMPQLDRFKQNIKTTRIDGDPEETNRREGLARCAPFHDGCELC